MTIVMTLSAIAASTTLVVMLCLNDPKRRRAAGLSERQLSTRMRRSLAAAAVVPGAVCAFNGDAAAFLMWLGGSGLAGWGAALCIRNREPTERSKPGRI